MLKSELEVKIVNVVVTSKLHERIDISKLTKHLPRSMYEPESFSGLVYKRFHPNATIILFSSGKITSTGTTSEELGKKSVHESVFEIEQIIGHKIKHDPISTVNIVAVGTLDTNIDLLKLRTKKNIKYEPERFPAAIIELNSYKGLIFKSGKIIVAGAKSEKQSKEIIHSIFLFLKKNNFSY